MQQFPEGKMILFQEKIVQYYYEHGRKWLPWRHTTDPWKILISEMLLRKTTAHQVSKVYEKLTSLSPKEIMGIDREALEDALKPLGIHKERARLIQDAAGVVAASEASDFSDEEFLRKIPGAGSYVVNTVLCFAYGRAKPALDRNMIRVIERVFSIRSERPRPHTDPKLWAEAESLVPVQHPKEYNWGVLDFSSAVCRPKPLCEVCPINKICDFYQNQVTSSD